MMTRDQFAAAALTGILASGFGKVSGSEVVAIAYELADGMVRRQKPVADNDEIFELACAVADAFVLAKEAREKGNLKEATDGLYTLVARLEEATRPRAMRKVRP